MDRVLLVGRQSAVRRAVAPASEASAASTSGSGRGHSSARFRRAIAGTCSVATHLGTAKREIAAAAAEWFLAWNLVGLPTGSQRIGSALDCSFAIAAGTVAAADAADAASRPAVLVVVCWKAMVRLLVTMLGVPP